MDTRVRVGLLSAKNTILIFMAVPNEIIQTKELYELFAKHTNQSKFFKQLVKNNHTYRHVLRFFGNLSMFATLLLAQIILYRESSLLSLLIFPAYVYLQSGVIFSLMVHSHELSHDHIKVKWLNDTLGIISGAFIGLNFYSFKYAHQLHHVNIGNLDAPEIGAPVSLRGRQRLGQLDVHSRLLQIFRKNKLIAYLITWPVHLYHGDYASWVLPFRIKKGIHLGGLLCFLALLTVNTALLLSFGLSYLLLYLAPVFLAGTGILMLTFLHHAHEDSIFFDTKHHGRQALMMFTTDRNYGPIGNFFMLNNGFHIPHHLNPMIAYYDLQKASEYLQKTIPAELKYNYYKNSNLYRDFVDGIYEQRLDHDPEYYQLKYLGR